MPESKARRQFRTFAGIVVLIVAAVLAGGALILARDWPFSRHAVMRELQSRLKGRFTRAETQKPVNALAASAEDKARNIREPKEAEASRTATETVRGQVTVRDGIAKLDNVSLEFPGAMAQVAGMFQLSPLT